jgi:hypothetical protein
MPNNNLGIGDLQSAFSGESTLTAAQKIQAQKNIIPKITTTARDALSGTSLFPGLIIYNITTNKYNIRAAAAWEVVTSA